MLKKAIQKWKDMPLSAKSFTANTVCRMLQRSLALITMPLFTRLLTTTEYGQYNVYLAWTGIFSIFITLNLSEGSFATAMVRYEESRDKYVAAVQNIGLVFGLVFLALYLPFRNVLNPLLEMPTAFVILMVAEIIGQHCLSCWQRVKQFDYKYKQVIAMTTLSTVAMPVLAYILVINSEEKGYARVLGYAMVAVIIGSVLYIRGLIKGKGGLKKEFWKYALLFNIPLIPYYLSQVIFNQSDRIMISHYFGTDKAGIYSLAYTLSMIFTFLINAVDSCYVPWLYRMYKEGKEKETRNVSVGLSAVVAFILMGVIALAPEIIGIMAGQAYMEAIWVVPPVTISLLLMYYTRLLVNVEFYYEKKTMMVWSAVGSAILNVVLNMLLLPKFGFIAAGYTTLVSYAVLTVANYFAVRKLAKQQSFDMATFDLKGLLGILSALTILSAIAMALYAYPIARFAIIGVVFLGLGIFHKRVIAFVKTLLKR